MPHVKNIQTDLKDSPVIVLSNNDGCIVAASGEAKEAGIKRAQPLFEQKKAIKEKKIKSFLIKLYAVCRYFEKNHGDS